MDLYTLELKVPQLAQGRHHLTTAGLERASLKMDAAQWFQ